jgi:hypothetical protein
MSGKAAVAKLAPQRAAIGALGGHPGVRDADRPAAGLVGGPAHVTRSCESCGRRAWARAGAWPESWIGRRCRRCTLLGEILK